MEKSEDCPHCDEASLALQHPFLITNNFYVVCDIHPLTEGHILIIPKKHISCVGAFTPELFAEFTKLYNQFSQFILKSYGSVSIFEHGVIGQTVFHAHVHIMPFSGTVEAIVPEGKDKVYPLKNLSELPDIFRKDEKYLFFSVGNKMWIVDTSLGVPRFFRDRFAKALGAPERGNWKSMHKDKGLMEVAGREIERVQAKWKTYNTTV